MMPESRRSNEPSNTDQDWAASAVDQGDLAQAHDRGFGLGLFLLSALAMVTGVAATILFDWRAGLALFLTTTLVLALFLRWEMRRRTVRREAALAVQASPDLIVTETSQL